MSSSWCASTDVDVAVVICEDLWRDGGPVGRVLEADAGILLTINASPFERDKDEVRLPLVTRRAVETDTDRRLCEHRRRTGRPRVRR
jgi:predicted amidohydrolase